MFKPIGKTRELLRLANDLHRINARLIVLAEGVADKETDSAALQKVMVTFKEGVRDGS